jgi:hypothetical protein
MSLWATILVLAPVPLWLVADYCEFLHAQSIVNVNSLRMKHLNSIAVIGDCTVWGVLNSRNRDVFRLDIQHGHIRNQWTSAVFAQLSWFAQWEPTGQEPQVSKSVTNLKFPSIRHSVGQLQLTYLITVVCWHVLTLCSCSCRQQEQCEVRPHGRGSSISLLYTETQMEKLLCCCVTWTFSETIKKNSVNFYLFS